MYISVLMSGRSSVALLLSTEKDRHPGIVLPSGLWCAKPYGLSSSLSRRLGDESGLALGVSFVRVLAAEIFIFWSGKIVVHSHEVYIL